jgi:phosphatidylglycerophosphate synthase
MRKLDRNDENFLENLILDLSEPLYPYFKQLNFTPNTITSLSFIFGLLAVYFLIHNKINYFAVSFLVSYIFDCMDGAYARKYKMTTQFGDLYDHATDLIVGFALIYISFKKYYNQLTPNIIIAFLTFTFLMQMHMGCQQANYQTSKDKGNKKKDEGETLDILQRLCLNPEHISWTKYFSPVSYVLFCILLVYYLQYCKFNS